MKDTNKELVSVIMPTYNRAGTIIRSINSIINQTYKNLELIIIDDCSSDNTVELIKGINNPKIKLIELNKNSGANYARNCGLNIAKGEYITFQDSDDMSDLNRIERLVNSCKINKCDVSFCNVQVVEKKGYSILIKNQIDNEDLLNKLLWGNFISLGSILGRKHVFESVKFDEKLPRFQDWDLMIRIVQKFKVVHLNEPLVDVFVQKDSITRNNKKGIDALQIILMKYDNLFSKKQKAKIYCRIGVFSSRDNKKSITWFKKAFQTHKKIYYLFLCIASKFHVINLLYKIRSKIIKIKNTKK